MKIDIPYDIGDPILVIENEQYDGMCIKCRPFRWSDLEHLDSIFRTRKDAETEFERRTKEINNAEN